MWEQIVFVSSGSLLVAYIIITIGLVIARKARARRKAEKAEFRNRKEKIDLERGRQLAESIKLQTEIASRIARTSE